MTPICAVDTETTSPRPDRRAWDIALIRRDDEGERRVQFFIELDALDLPNADPFSLNVWRFWERHPQATRLRAGQDIGCDAVELWSSWAKADVFAVPEGAVVDAATAAHIVAGMTHGAHLVGAVPNFDAEVLAALLRDNDLTPSFHYHLIDVEALAVDWPQVFRADRRIAERTCPHGVGHPDPDDPAAGRVHGCDGCCKETP